MTMTFDHPNKPLSNPTTQVSLVLQAKDERCEIDRLLAESKLLARKEALEQKEAIRAAQEDGRRRIEQIKATKLHSVSGDQGGDTWQG